MKIAFIGFGNMGRAIAGGIVAAGMCSCDDILACDIASGEYNGIKIGTDNAAAAGSADIVFLSVKPVALATAVESIKDAVSENTIIVSIVAGRDIASIEQLFAKKIKLVRLMPNTPALVGKAMIAVSSNVNVLPQEVDTVMSILKTCGEAEIVPEKLMDVVTGVSGSSPAFVYMFIEALADGAVAEGMPRAQAYKFAAQTVMGSAQMVLSTGKHPGELKDMVTSPAGTTIEGVAVLEEMGFRASVIDAVRAAVEKSRQL